MRSVSRLAFVVAAALAITMALVGCESPNLPPPTLEQATKYEQSGDKQHALAEYGRVVRDKQRSDPEAAANALYLGGLYASQRYGATTEEKHHGQDTALQMWRQLTNDFPSTKAAAAVTSPQPGAANGIFRDLEMQVNARNSVDWKYKIIDGLVRLTGKNPNFSYALALILTAFLVKLITLPLVRRQYASMREMQRIQPEVKKLQEKYKGAELSQKQMDLYKEHGVNPFAGCVPTVVMLPFLILVFTSIRLYEYAFLNAKFLWIGSSLSAQYPHIFAPNLASPDLPLLVLYVLTNYITMRITPASDPQQQQQQSTMATMTSVIFFWMFLTQKWSSAFVLYWFVLNLFTIWQQYEFIYKPHKARQAALGSAAPPDEGSGNDRRNGTGTAPTADRPLGASGEKGRVRPRKKKK